MIAIRVKIGLLACCAGLVVAAPQRAVPAPLDAAARAEVDSARQVFEANLDAIRHRDRDAYLATYLQSETLARTGPAGFRLGYAEHAAAAGSGWPDVFEALEMRLAPVRPGVVYGTYRYRVRFGEAEHAGLSERVFVRTPSGWRIAVTGAIDAPSGTPPPARALVGATLVDGTGRAPVRDAVVVLRDGAIACAGPRAACPLPDSIDVLDLRGLWITPGLVDAHLHLSQSGWVDGRPDLVDVGDMDSNASVQADLRAHPERALRACLCSGVTSVFDAGGYAWTWDLRSRQDTRSPRVAAAGPWLAPAATGPDLPGERRCIVLAGEADARAGVRYLASQQSDAVKFWFVPAAARDVATQERLVAAAGDEARAVGLPLVAHALGLSEAKAALRAGATFLVHGVDDALVDEEFLSLAREAGAVYCPTLVAGDGILRFYEAARSGRVPLVDDPHACVDSLTLSRLAATASLAGRVDARRVLAANAAFAARRLTSEANLRRVHAAGIPIAMGTDAGSPLTLHGVAVHAEMEAMQAAGLDAATVLAAATAGGARALGRLDRIGTVEAGKTADLLVVEADPTQDIANLRRRRWVVRGGVVRAQAELQQRSER